MKRYLIYSIGLVLAGLISPFVSSDVGQLQPVEVVAICGDAHGVTVETDTGDLGIGEDLPSALDNLCSTSTKHIFLDTAEYLLLSGSAEALLPQLTEHFRPSCGVCLGEGITDLTLAGEYLDNHGLASTLADHRAEAIPLAIITQTEERMHLELPQR